MEPTGGQREAVLAQMAAQLPFCYVPRFYQPEYAAGAWCA